MSALVNELLSFSKAGLNAQTVPLAPVDVAGAVNRAAARETFSGATIATSIPPGLAVMANESFLIRALSNILRNAVRYAGSGPIHASAERAGGGAGASLRTVLSTRSRPHARDRWRRPGSRDRQDVYRSFRRHRRRAQSAAQWAGGRDPAKWRTLVAWRVDIRVDVPRG